MDSERTALEGPLTPSGRLYNTNGGTSVSDRERSALTNGPSSQTFRYVTTQVPGEHFVINKTRDVPAFLRKAEQIAQHGELQVKVKDITGCYPNMPKETIRFAMRD
jgi:hypothetical protein